LAFLAYEQASFCVIEPHSKTWALMINQTWERECERLDECETVRLSCLSVTSVVWRASDH
jgi:hypothetical protein